MKLEKSVDLPGQAPKKGFQVDTDLWVFLAYQNADLTQRTNQSMSSKHQLENQWKSKNISKHGVSEIEVLVWLHTYDMWHILSSLDKRTFGGQRGTANDCNDCAI